MANEVQSTKLAITNVEPNKLEWNNCVIKFH